jgi:hypothetical protein
MQPDNIQYTLKQVGDSSRNPGGLLPPVTNNKTTQARTQMLSAKHAAGQLYRNHASCCAKTQHSSTCPLALCCRAIPPNAAAGHSSSLSGSTANRSCRKHRTHPVVLGSLGATDCFLPANSAALRCMPPCLHDRVPSTCWLNNISAA